MLDKKGEKKDKKEDKKEAKKEKKDKKKKDESGDKKKVGNITLEEIVDKTGNRLALINFIHLNSFPHYKNYNYWR